MDKLKKSGINKSKMNIDVMNSVELLKHQRSVNILNQTNLNMHNNNHNYNSNSLDKRVINGAKKLTPLTGSRSSSSSNRYQTAAMASAIDFDYLEEKLKQIQANSDQTKKLLPTSSASNPILKSSIKPTTPRKSSEEKLDVDSSNKKINFKSIPLTKSSPTKKELQRSISNMDHQRPVTTSSLKQKINQNSKKEKKLSQLSSSQQQSQQTRAQSQLSYSTNKLNTSNSHYDSQPIYEDDFIEDYTDDDQDDIRYFRKNQSKENKKENAFNGKHIPNRSVSNMSYSNKIKHKSNLLHKKSKSTHLSHMEINSSSMDSSSESKSSSSVTSRSSSFDNIVKTKKSNRLKMTDKDRRVNSANNKVNTKSELSEPHSHPLNIIQPRRASTANLTTPRSIAIRREKSINTEGMETNRSNFSEKISINSFMDELSIKGKQDKNSNLKQSLLASIANTGVNNKESSSTTSGIESSSKNSTANGNESNDCKLSIENNSSLNSPNNINNNNNNMNNYILKINELKNSIFVLEIELKNERKKLNVEKDLKEKLVVELKKRFQVEKEAALKAQEARLNAEKLFELNKVKDDIDLEKRDEYYQNQKTFDTELINLQLKLREKSEK